MNSSSDVGSSHFGPSCRVVAEEERTGQIAGASRTRFNPDWIKQTKRQEGYVHTLSRSTPGAWQRLGTALLVDSLHVLAKRAWTASTCRGMQRT